MLRLATFFLNRLRRDRGGLATVEFGLVLSTLVLLMMNGVEAARFYYGKMQLQNAAQMASQAAYSECDTSHLPATTNCTGLTSAVTTALQSTPLGSEVTQAGSLSEGYYCVVGGALTLAGPITGDKPVDCSASGGLSSDQPADYLVIQAQYTYTPIFSGMSIGSLLPTTVTSTTRMRLQ
jgi:Flp pilus assembly protein TadG